MQWDSEDEMYQIGAYVIYGVQGVCRVVGREIQRVNRVKCEYLVLEPMDKSESRFYLPTGNPSVMAKLKQVLTKEELEHLLTSVSESEQSWIPEENQRKQHYRELISGGDRMSLMRMLSALYRHREQQQTAGRKFHLCDENFLRDTERLLGSEVALIMDCTPEEARSYLRMNLK